MLLPNLGVDPGTGDFARAAEANGELAEANASKPDRLGGLEGVGDLVDENEDLGVKAGCAVVETSESGVEGVGLAALRDANTFCPLTDANGEDTDA